VIIADLPVESGKRVREARIDGGLRQNQLALRVDLDIREKLLQMDVEILGQGTRDVALEDDDECTAGEPKRNQDCNDAASDKS